MITNTEPTIKFCSLESETRGIPPIAISIVIGKLPFSERCVGGWPTQALLWLEWGSSLSEYRLRHNPQGGPSFAFFAKGGHE